MVIKKLRGDFDMDRLSSLFLATLMGGVILLTGSVGAALGHPVAEVAMPDYYFYWSDQLVLLRGDNGIDEGFTLSQIIEEEEKSDVKIIEHVVVSGDTIRSIARENNISESTILNNNNISNPNLIVLGQKLTFPSIDGIIYQVKRGDTLSQIARTYQTTVEEILSVNEVAVTEMPVGTTLILPNAKPIIVQRNTVSRSSNVATTSTSSSLRGLLWPVNGVITSTYGWRRNPMNRSETQFHSGLDIGASRGTPIRAATAGEVVLSGWQSGYGYTVILKHGNDYTLYAHASSLTVKKGQWVSAGQEIARVGATGNATGPHLHFEVRVRSNSSQNTVNPINYLSVR